MRALTRLFRWRVVCALCVFCGVHEVLCHFCYGVLWVFDRDEAVDFWGTSKADDGLGKMKAVGNFAQGSIGIADGNQNDAGFGDHHITRFAEARSKGEGNRGVGLSPVGIGNQTDRKPASIMASLGRRRHDPTLAPTDYGQTEPTNSRTDEPSGVQLGRTGFAWPDEANGEIPRTTNGANPHQGLNRTNGLCLFGNRGFYPAPIPRIKPSRMAVECRWRCKKRVHQFFDERAKR